MEPWPPVTNPYSFLGVGEPLRCYEAYVIYSFFEYLVAYIGDEQILVCILGEKAATPHIWPFNYVLRPWKMGEEFLRGCKAGVHSYVRHTHSAPHPPHTASTWVVSQTAVPPPPPLPQVVLKPLTTLIAL